MSKDLIIGIELLREGLVGRFLNKIAMNRLQIVSFIIMIRLVPIRVVILFASSINKHAFFVGLEFHGIMISRR